MYQYSRNTLVPQVINLFLPLGYWKTSLFLDYTYSRDSWSVTFLWLHMKIAF